MHIVGELSAVFILSQIGFVIVLIGIVLCYRRIPASYRGFCSDRVSLFAIPLPYFIDAELTLRLQLISSELGAFLIRPLGIPVYLDGNIIDLGHISCRSWKLAADCVIYILSSVSVFSQHTFSMRRAGNASWCFFPVSDRHRHERIRIGLVGLLVDRWGTAMAEGALHLFEGWVIFLACGAHIAVGNVSDVAFFPEEALGHFVFPATREAAALASVASCAQSARFTCLSLLCLAGAAVPFVSGEMTGSGIGLGSRNFPPVSAPGKAVPPCSTRNEGGLGPSDYILSDYSRPDGKSVNLYVAYYASQRKGELPHSPIVCIPGGGWTITNLHETASRHRRPSL